MKQGLESPDLYNEFISRINNINENSQALWGSMNSAQMIKHLSLDAEIILGKLEVKNISNFLTRTLFKTIILGNINSPKGGKTIHELDVINSNVPVSNFETEKQYYLKLIKEILNSDTLSKNHPVLGKMSSSQWYRYIYRHSDYHFKQFGI